MRNFRCFSFWATSTLQKSHLVLNSVASGFADYIAKIGEGYIPPPDFFETALRNAAGRSFSGLRLAFRAAPRPLRNCSCRRRKPGMSGRRESPRTAFRARRKSGRRPIPIIYIGEIIRPLFSQSGSGAVFVVVRAVSATPYRKTISPQTAQLSLLLLSLSMIGTTDGFLSDKSIRKLNDSVNTTLSMTPNPIFIGGGNF